MTVWDTEKMTFICKNQDCKTPFKDCVICDQELDPLLIAAKIQVDSLDCLKEFHKEWRNWPDYDPTAPVGDRYCCIGCRKDDLRRTNPYNIYRETGYKSSKIRDNIPKALKHHVLCSANWTCHYCGTVVPFDQIDTLQVDHKIPISRGGTDDDWNLVCACRPCNEEKCDSDYELYCQYKSSQVKWLKNWEEIKKYRLND